MRSVAQSLLDVYRAAFAVDISQDDVVRKRTYLNVFNVPQIIWIGVFLHTGANSSAATK